MLRKKKTASAGGGDEILILPSESPARPDWISCFPKGSGVVQPQEQLGLVLVWKMRLGRGFSSLQPNQGSRHKSESEIPVNFREMSSPWERRWSENPSEQ